MREGERRSMPGSLDGAHGLFTLDLRVTAVVKIRISVTEKEAGESRSYTEWLLVLALPPSPRHALPLASSL
ncbi:hypothetical protein D9611_010122 [Ephemerocybe angulata]|uniref:Uncharacterized protein n=1 Tax=Ephemerocybe angulata TaxID=980116 RepID=A0A8H5AZC3_9AGAR|nr:hypothetical protein D9611_010122 [Tulosesus angulatus]